MGHPTRVVVRFLLAQILFPCKGGAVVGGEVQPDQERLNTVRLHAALPKLCPGAFATAVHGGRLDRLGRFFERDTMEKNVNKGTTTVGLVCSDGVVMATEMRATMGNLISHKSTKKLFEIDDHLGMTVAGLVGDAQALARILRAEAEMYGVQRNTPMTVKAASTLLSNLMNQRKFAPYMVQLLVGGVDDDGAHLYSLDAAGGSIPDDFITTGSGSPFVYGVLEDLYEEGMDLDAGVDLAVRALTAAMQRDSASGDGIALCTITESDGFVQLTEAELDERRAELGLA
jgi:proteasome beta subunit